MPTVQRQREKTGNWSQIFPNEQVSAQQSTVFVKKLLAVAVSNITYLRAIFPEHAYGDRCLEDLNLKILKDDSSCAGACQVIQWVKGCFDALDKKYLKIMIIGIYTDPEKPDTVIESYTFKFSYTEDGGVDIYRNKEKISSAHTAAETKKATIRLLRTIVILTQNLHSLPDDVFMTMKLLYYDDVTPTDYEPPGFQEAATDGFLFDEEPMNIKVGDVMTPFHTVKLRIKTDKNQFETADPLSQPEISEEPINVVQANDIGLDNEDEPMEEISPVLPETDSNNNNNQQPSQTSPVPTQISNSGGGEQFVPQPMEGDSVPVTSPNEPDSDLRAASTTGSQQVSIQSQEDYGVNCGCGYNEDDGLMILCAKCKTWQHAVCHRILEEEKAPVKHICDICADAKDPELQATDTHLATLTPIAKEATCLWRRALFVCQETTKILVPTLAKRLGIEYTVAHGLLSRLEKEGYLKSAKSKRHGKIVDKQMLEKGLKKYFFLDVEENANNISKCAEMVEDKKKRVNDEIDRITARAETINLAGKRSTKKDKEKQNQLPDKVNGSHTVQLSESQTSNSQTDLRKGKKRAKSTSGPGNYDFEISDSQDVQQDHCPRDQSKKRKSSAAKKSVHV